MLPGGMPVERVAGCLEIHILGQNDRELVPGHWYHAAGVAVDERNRRAPIALARNAPVAQPPDGLALPAAPGLDTRNDLALGILDAQAVEEAGVDDDAVAAFGLARERLVRIRSACRHDARDRQTIFGREFEVAAVVARHRHDRAGAVIHQDEVGDEDGQMLAGEGMPRTDASI